MSEERGGRLLLLGAGYCARGLAKDLLARGWEVRGTTRTSAGADALAALGIEPFLFDAERPLDLRAWEGVSHLLASVPPSAEGDPALELVRRHQPRLAWLGYLSSTGVYGDHAGAWVDEESELRPAGSERPRRRQEAEASWRRLSQPWHVFRLSGIYGPGRGPLARVLEFT